MSNVRTKCIYIKANLLLFERLPADEAGIRENYYG